ncbi:MAG: DUF2283 domain-containing protein [Calditrichaeota bacterium]|nr:DUF2283 domain-containing protein [Calditrichota bacterium]
MHISYNSKHDLLYIRFSYEDKPVRNERFDEDIVFDIDADDKIVGMEILDASKRIDLRDLLTVRVAGAN